MTTWRDVLPVHPAADLFPLLGDDELRELGEDIKAHGLYSPIVLWVEGHSLQGDPVGPTYLLDGRNRLAALELCGVRFEGAGRKALDHALDDFYPDPDSAYDSLVVTYDGWTEEKTGEQRQTTAYGDWEDVTVRTPGIDPYEYVVGANIKRRHLTGEQKRDIIAHLLTAQPKRSNRQTGKIAQVDHKTVAAVRTDLERRGEIPHVETVTDTRGREQPAARPRQDEDAADYALLDRIDPDGAERQRQVELRAEWGKTQARLGKDVLTAIQLLAINDGEVMTLEDEVERMATEASRDLWREYTDRLDKALEATAGLRIVPGEK